MLFSILEPGKNYKAKNDLLCFRSKEGVKDIQNAIKTTKDYNTIKKITDQVTVQIKKNDILLYIEKNDGFYKCLYNETIVYLIENAVISLNEL